MGKKVALIGFPMDLGASRRGVDMGPFALRVAQITSKLKLLGYDVADKGNIDIPFPENLSDPPDPKAKFLKEITEANRRLADVVYDCMREGYAPLVLGGDHSLAIGSVAGTSKYFKEQNKKMGLLWLDAHADINTPETTSSGNIHGMPVSHILGLGDRTLSTLHGKAPMVDPAHTVIVGLRDVEDCEKETIRKLGLRVFTMQDIDERGLGDVMGEALRWVCEGTAGFHLSFDVDWLDPQGAPGVGTPSPGGATYREGHLAMEKAFDTGKIVALDIAEVNPIMDHANLTATIAVEMAVSAFGKKIL